MITYGVILTKITSFINLNLHYHKNTIVYQTTATPNLY